MTTKLIMEQEQIAADVAGSKSFVKEEAETSNMKPTNKSTRDVVAGAMASGTPVVLGPPSGSVDVTPVPPSTGGVVVRPETATLANSVMIGSKPSMIKEGGMRFIIMDAPRQSNLHMYIRLCRDHNVANIVRVCEPTYLTFDLVNAGIEVHELAYPDGHSPPVELVDRWLALVERVFFKPQPGAARAKDDGDGSEASKSSKASASRSEPCIAVHCVAGLGRAPVLVAIALIEFAKLDPFDAVMLIRKNRRGAINETQMNYLVEYRPHYCSNKAAQGGCCIVM